MFLCRSLHHEADRNTTKILLLSYMHESMKNKLSKEHIFYTSTHLVNITEGELESLQLSGEKISEIDLETLRSKTFSFPKYLHGFNKFEPLVENHSGLDARTKGIRFEEYCSSKTCEAHEAETQSAFLKMPPSNKHTFPCRNDPAFIIHPERVGLALDSRTTCMIRNIPNKFTQKMLVELLNEDHFGTYNFVYLRMDFKNRCNAGYAFVNFSTSQNLISFYIKIHGAAWKHFNSDKIAQLTYARIQGLRCLKKRFQGSEIMEKEEGYRPKTFYSHGSMKGLEKPFSHWQIHR